MQSIARKNGATISQNITNKTTLLVMGERPGSKLDRAFNKGIHIMMDEEFLNIVTID
jgi:DNA ligase (NAD+)